MHVCIQGHVCVTVFVHAEFQCAAPISIVMLRKSAKMYELPQFATWDVLMQMFQWSTSVVDFLKKKINI